jgi:transcriptional regulator with XRE-family HTH domain
MTAAGKEKLLKIGRNIQKWRELKGMKQGSLAEELDISLVALSNIETGKTNIPLIRLFSIATALEIPIEFLFADPNLVIRNAKNLNGLPDRSNFST